MAGTERHTRVNRLLTLAIQNKIKLRDSPRALTIEYFGKMNAFEL